MTHLRRFILIISWTCFATLARGQTAEQFAQLPPKEIYFQAWSLAKAGDQLKQKKDFAGAFSKYRKAVTFFNFIKINHPNHEPDLVDDRISLAERSMGEIHDFALAQQREKDGNESGLIIEGNQQQKPELTIPERVDRSGENAIELQELQDEIEDIEEQLSQMDNPRTVEATRLRSKVRTLKLRRARLGAAPLKNDVAELTRQILQLRRERNAMEHARNLAREREMKTLEKLEKTQRLLAESRENEAELMAMIDETAEINGQIAAGQQEKIDNLREKIREQDQIIAEANTTIGDLRVQLDQSNTMVADLELERENLIQERDQFKAFLSIKEGDRLQKLVDQNVGLSRELTAAKANLKVLQEDKNASVDSILKAKQIVAVSKAKIKNLGQTNTQANSRIEKLEKQLEQANQDLLAQIQGEELNDRGRHEVTMLRQVVDKLHARIEAQKTAAQFIIEQAELMGEEDADYKNAVDLITQKNQVEFTEEELDLISSTPSNPSFTVSDLPTPEERRLAKMELGELTNDLNLVAQKLFQKGDYQAARGNLELIVDENPGAWETMVNLGIIHLKLDEPTKAANHLRNAILVTGDHKNHWAHFMLGDALYREGLFPEASKQIKTSLTIESENAKAHVLLGNIAGKTGDLDGAEFHFKEAIKQNPELFEPYLNLAIIYHQLGKQDEAKEFYQQHLRKGGPARPELAEKLKV